MPIFFKFFKQTDTHPLEIQLNSFFANGGRHLVRAYYNTELSEEPGKINHFVLITYTEKAKEQTELDNEYGEKNAKDT